MSKSHSTLCGNVPDKSAVALLMIDFINDLDFRGSTGLRRQILPIAKRLAALRKRMYEVGGAVIYVNDNFGRWRSNFQSQIKHCLEKAGPAKELVTQLHPTEDDYFVLKPAHSGFYSTNLELLLLHLQADTLIVTGVATNICVLFTANDAYLRGYRIVVPQDCVAANTKRLGQVALQQMRSILRADTRPAKQLPLGQWMRRKVGHPRNRGIAQC